MSKLRAEIIQEANCAIADVRARLAASRIKLHRLAADINADADDKATANRMLMRIEIAQKELGFA